MRTLTHVFVQQKLILLYFDPPMANQVKLHVASLFQIHGGYCSAMSTPVITDRWAGNFDCDFCRRKRLVGEEFSKKVRIKKVSAASS
jgi:hypothetical protein